MATTGASGRTLLEDEWNIDFEDTRSFLLESWKAANSTHSLSNAEKKQAVGYVNSKAFSDYVLKEQAEARKLGQHWKATGLTNILNLVRQLTAFESLIQELCDTVQDRESDSSEEVVVMESIDISPLWQLSYLNIKFSANSSAKFKLVSKWMNDLRRSLELLVSAVRQSSELETIEENSVRMELLEVFEPLMGIMHESAVYLQRQFNEEDFVGGWTRFFDSKIRDNQSSITDTIKHIREVNANGRQEQSQTKGYISEMGIRDRILPNDGSEKAIFPLEMLPQFHTECFVGRQKDIDKIHGWLDHSEPGKIRKYHIYGRRGIGKTQLALEYSRQHRERYDAIFWIQCETKASLRQSFAEIATKLELIGSDVNVLFSESLTRVLRWLRQTQKKWLLIYDNAERSNLLKGYWPVGGQGAMLLTSRSYYNFFEDEHRQGETVNLFNNEEREQLLLTLLGNKWQAEHLGDDEMLSAIEHAAIKTLLRETGGLPIAIHQATKLIKDEDINPGQTTRRFMEMFRNKFNTLPRRHHSDRDPLIKALDTVWAISFDILTKPAKTILQCISFLAPDKILIDLFMPTNQALIPDCLDFCRATPNTATPIGQPFQTFIGQTEALQSAIQELEQKGLIRINGRAISIHRTIQEAVVFEDKAELQTRFEATTNLLYDAFPKQIEGRPLQDSWFQCREWILHAMQLAVKYRKYNTDGATDEMPLKGEKATETCACLLANAAWYLYEIADYDECLNLVAVARNAIYDKNSILYASVTNIEGCAYYEMNYLRPSRAALEICLEIRQKLLSPGHAEIANVMGNLGNVESAEGNYAMALDYMEKAAEIRTKLGNDAAVYLALTYMQIGRVYALQNKEADAYQMFQKSESLLNRKAQRNKLFLGHIHYEFGSLELKQGDLEQAATSFEKARHFARAQGALLPLTASTNYKMGVVEFAMGHHKKALNYLNKALDIAETRNPGELDGGVVRVQWKIAEVVLDDPNDPFGEQQKEGLKLKHEAELRRQEIAAKLEINLQGLDDSQDAEKMFDLLVCGYFR